MFGKTGEHCLPRILAIRQNGVFMGQPAKEPETIDGLVNLYKPVGRSSAQYVYRLRPILGIRKVGHAGTLDPFADGVLLACLGKATKLVERLMDLPKKYRTTLRLGVTNASFDTEYPFEPVVDAAVPDRVQVDAAVSALIGEIQQTPPAFSAMRVGGVFSYKLAKKGKAPELAARPVRIYDITVNRYEYPQLELAISCGRGTYIRAIARDLGESLGCGAVCESLTRLAVGPFTSDDALRFEGASPLEVREAILPISTIREMVVDSGASDIP